MSGKQPLSPQGYNIGTDPKNFNPFWEQVQGSGIGDVTASAETVPPTDPAEAAVTETDNPETGKTDLSFDFKIPAGPAGPAGTRGRGINTVDAETETGPAGGEADVVVRETVDQTTGDLDLLFHFDIPGSYFPPAEPKLDPVVIDMTVGSKTVKALQFNMTKAEYDALIAAPPPALVLFYITLSTRYTHPDGQMMITPVKVGRNSVGTAFLISPMMFASGHVYCGNGSLGGGNWGFRLFYQINGVAYDFPDYALTSIKYMLGW